MFDINIFDSTSTHLCECHDLDNAREGIFFSSAKGSLLQDARRTRVDGYLTSCPFVCSSYVLSRSNERRRRGKREDREEGGGGVRAIKARPNKYKR